MGFFKVASEKDLASGKAQGVKANGKPILLANVDGNYYAMGNVCTHMGCTLSEGTLKANIVQCPCHGSRFDVKTGKVIGGPATRPEPAYEVKLESGQILVKV